MAEPTELPENPHHFPDCCVAISRALIYNLISIFPSAPKRIISIGCGSGLLESMILMASHSSLDLIGVEVNAKVNRHLPIDACDTVSGTWATYPNASNASTWMFVYPREPRLLALYLQKHVTKSLEQIVWIGPRNDWTDYHDVFAAGGLSDITMLEDGLVAAYEAVVIVKAQ